MIKASYKEKSLFGFMVPEEFSLTMSEVMAAGEEDGAHILNYKH